MPPLKYLCKQSRRSELRSFLPPPSLWAINRRFCHPTRPDPALVPQDGFKGRCLLWVLLDIERTSMILNSFVGGGVVDVSPEINGCLPPGCSQLTGDHYQGLLREPPSSQFDRQAEDQRFLQTIRQLKALKRRWW